MAVTELSNTFIQFLKSLMIFCQKVMKFGLEDVFAITEFFQEIK